MDTRRALLAGAVGIALVVAACGSPEEPEVPQAQPSATESPVPSAEPTGEPAPEPTEPIGATVDDIEAFIAGQRDLMGWRDGTITEASCAAAGEIHRGDALTCTVTRTWPNSEWQEVSQAYVAVLDDEGRFVYSLDDPAINTPSPADYDPGTISCATLLAPPPGSGQLSGLSYFGVLYHWMALGMPMSMDDDRNGWPCETVYPAEAVGVAQAAPMRIGGGTFTDQPTMLDLALHYTGLTTVLAGDVMLDCAMATGGDTGQPAAAGEVISCAVQPVEPMEWGSFDLVALDSSGRYAVAFWECCGAEPAGSWPPDATCADYSGDPSGVAPGAGLDYDHTYVAWAERGSPASWDSDGDGRPCEDYYPIDQVSAFFGRAIAP